MNQVIMKQTSALPMIVVRGLVVFPNTLLHFDMAREKSILALENAMVNKQLAFVTMQKDITIENPTPEDVEKMGTICKITQVVKMPNNTVRVLVEGLKRAKINEILKTRPYFVSLVDEIESEEFDEEDLENEALKRKLVDEFMNYRDYNRKLNGDFLFAQQNMENMSRLCDNLASNLPLKLSDKQDILNTADIKKRAEKLIELLIRETEIAKIDSVIDKKVKSNIDKNQREYFLREQMKVIQEELGDKEGVELEAEEYKKKLAELNLPDDVREKCNKD